MAAANQLAVAKAAADVLVAARVVAARADAPAADVLVVVVQAGVVAEPVAMQLLLPKFRHLSQLDPLTNLPWKRRLWLDHSLVSSVSKFSNAFRRHRVT